MNKHKNENTAGFIAQLLSDVFSPILLSTYTIIVVLWLSRYNFVSINARLLTVAAVFIATAFVPALAITILMKAGMVSDVAISNRRQRFIPFGITAVASLCAFFWIRHIGFPYTVAYFLLAASVIAVIEAIISSWWKISAHAGAFGAVIPYFYYFAQANLLIINGLFTLSVTIMLVGMVGWSRIYLGRHTPAQVFAGAALGALVIVLLHSFHF